MARANRFGFIAWLSRVVFLSVLLVLAVLIADFFRFCDGATRQSLPIGRINQAPHGDGIVVFTGKSDARVARGVALLEQGHGSELLISGVFEGATKSEIRAISGGTRQTFNCCVTLGHDAKDTIGNAIELASWAKARHMEQVVLVTEAYHVRRARLEAEAAIRDAHLGTKIVVDPVYVAPFAGANWREDKSLRRQLFSEYIKGLAVMARVYLGLDIGETSDNSHVSKKPVSLEAVPLSSEN